MYEDLYNIDSAKNALSTVLTPEKVSEILHAFSAHDIKATHKDEWFAEMKSIATELGYAPDGKTFKANPDQYKGSIADVAMVLRIALTERTKAPDMYAVMNVLGVEQSKMRFKNLA
jgi:glutamyl-tRNA synthetase